jgi:hypothetical protein
MSDLSAKIRRLFLLASELIGDLWNHEGCFESSQMSVEDFVKFVEDAHCLKITFKRVKVQTNSVLGHIERYDEGKLVVIYTVSNLDPYEQRLVEVKEICQVVLDEKSDWSCDGIDTLQRISNPIDLDMSSPENIALLSERLALILAYELLYPIENRVKDIQRISDGIMIEEDLADELKIPIEVVRNLLAPHMIKWSQHWWVDITSTSNAQMPAPT